MRVCICVWRLGRRRHSRSRLQPVVRTLELLFNTIWNEENLWTEKTGMVSMAACPPPWVSLKKNLDSYFSPVSVLRPCLTWNPSSNLIVHKCILYLIKKACDCVIVLYCSAQRTLSEDALSFQILLISYTYFLRVLWHIENLYFLHINSFPDMSYGLQQTIARKSGAVHSEPLHSLSNWIKQEQKYISFCVNPVMTCICSSPLHRTPKRLINTQSISYPSFHTYTYIKLCHEVLFFIFFLH